MRFPLRKVLKASIILGFLISLNVFVFVYRDSADYSHKLDAGDSRYKRNGVNKRELVAHFDRIDMGVKLSLQDFHRIQRSAKSMPDERKRAAVVVPAKITHRHGIQTTKKYKTLNKRHKETELRDVFISVKTTKKFHQSRVRLLLHTWFILARDETYFFTDSDDPDLNKSLGGHLINTNCSSIHNRQGLCCKMAIEYDTFIESNKRWFCHMDDDTYVNIPQLVKMLRGYNHHDDWYLGKPSMRYPIEIMDRDKPGQKLTFWFATGGAGFCISRGLALKMMPYASGGRLMTMGEKIRLPDDCTIGYIIDYVLKKPLTVIEGFHSHLEALWRIPHENLHNEITFSYSKYGDKMNIVNVPGFTELEDPSRVRSIHCYLFPTFRECKSVNLRRHKSKSFTAGYQYQPAET